MSLVGNLNRLFYFETQHDKVFIAVGDDPLGSLSVDYDDQLHRESVLADGCSDLFVFG